MDHRVIETGGVRLAYRVCGSPEAPPLVLLHALGEDSTDWDGVMPALARHRRVYALDLRGHGRSDRPGDYSLELMRADVLGVLDALALERVDLIGHSMGGVVAYLLAGRHPERVGRLILEDAPAPLPREPSVPTRPDGELPYDWRWSWPFAGRSTTPTRRGRNCSARSPRGPSSSPAGREVTYPGTTSGS